MINVVQLLVPESGTARELAHQGNELTIVASVELGESGSRTDR